MGGSSTMNLVSSKPNLRKADCVLYGCIETTQFDCGN
jgi:hypothetical protein